MAIRRDTRTTHTISIDIPDDVIAGIESGDDIEVMFYSRAQVPGEVRTPRPLKLSYAWSRYLTGKF